MRCLGAKYLVWGLLILSPMAGPSEVASQPADTERVKIEYVPPTNSDHNRLYERLVTAKVLEKARNYFLPFKLPRPLLLKVTPCNGEQEAWFEDDAITICYEYLQFIERVATQKNRPDWVTEQATILGGLVDVFLHEGGHAIFDMLKIPVFGREEDAADQFSAYTLLKLYPDDAPMLIAGIVYLYLGENGAPPKRRKMKGMTVRLDAKKLSDVHSTPEQRAYSLLCIAYGADQERYKDLVEKGVLPSDRADGCEDEFEQLTFAYRTLVVPHLDVNVVRRLFPQVKPTPSRE